MQRKLVLLLGIVVAVAALAMACSDSDDGDDDAEMEAEHAASANVGVLAALATLADANLHHVEGTLTGDDPEIDPTWIAPITNARTAVALVEWPEALHEASANFLADSMPLLMALSDDDVEAAAEAAPQAHASWHLLRDPGYAYLAEQAGTGSMDMAGGHDHEDGDDADHEDGEMDMDDGSDDS